MRVSLLLVLAAGLVASVYAQKACAPGYRACGESACYLNVTSTSCFTKCSGAGRCSSSCSGPTCTKILDFTPSYASDSVQSSTSITDVPRKFFGIPNTFRPRENTTPAVKKPNYGKKVTMKGSIYFLSTAVVNPSGAELPLDVYVDAGAGNIIADYYRGKQVTYTFDKENGVEWAMYTHRGQQVCQNYSNPADIDIFDAYVNKVTHILRQQLANYTWVHSGANGAVNIFRLVVPHSVVYTLYTNASDANNPLYLLRQDTTGDSWIYRVESFTRNAPSDLFTLPVICKGISDAQVNSDYEAVFSLRWKWATLFKPKMKPSELPESYSLVDDGNVWQVKNQLSCGSCWAFAAAASMESVWTRAYGHPTSLSEQYINDCALSVAGCFGGFPSLGLALLINHTVPQSEQYGYSGINLDCFSAMKANNTDAVNGNPFKLDGHLRIPTGPKMADHLKEAVYRYGAVAVTMDASCLDGYAGGIVAPDPWYATGMDASFMNHAVTLVGWGFDENYNTSFWQVKNSWGPMWGEHGYFRVSTDFDCGITSDDAVVAWLKLLDDRFDAQRKSKKQLPRGNAPPGEPVAQPAKPRPGPYGW